MAQTYDFIVIGGGSAGFNAARVAAGHGLRTAVVDGARQLGGLCILRGCMPSKTLLYAAEVLHRAQHGADFGLTIGSARANLPALQARKRRIIGEFAGYRARQLKAGPYRLFRAQARFLDPHTILLSDGRRLTGRHFLIATGSKIATPPVPGLDRVKCWTSDEVLALDFVPPSVLVLGGGVVAVELAQYLRRIGSRVVLLQRSEHTLRDHSAEAARVVEAGLRADGIEVFTGTTITEVAAVKLGVSVTFRHRGAVLTRRARHLFNALGRSPNTAGLGLAAAGVRARADGQVAINRWQQTSAPHIYAAGDCSGPVEIVHVAIQQGELAARHAARVKGLKPIDYGLLLNVVFTDPQLATIGRPEHELVAAKVPFLSASYPFDDHGKSILMEAKLGFVKVLAEPKRGRILGAEIVGPDAGELIHCFSAALALRATVFDLLRAPWYHPTLAEIVTYPLEELAERISRRADPRDP
jgi:pyruvate/2-oxoglutarate dehydrogenase complex dihydrolipoamide dehydrogenase (E3) component